MINLLVIPNGLKKQEHPNISKKENNIMTTKKLQNSATPIILTADEIIERIKAQLNENEYTLINLTARELNTLRTAGKTDSSIAYQRPLKAQWIKPDYRGKFLDSILKGYPTGFIIVVLRTDGTLEFLDGKQRLNWYGLTFDSLGTFSNMEDETLNRTFNEFDTETKEKIFNYQIPFIVLPPMEDEERAEVFNRINSTAIKLTPIEARRGSILQILNDENFKNAVQTIYEIMPSTAGNQPSITSTEEIILQALGNRIMNNYDFTGSGNVDAIKKITTEQAHTELKSLMPSLQVINKKFKDEDFIKANKHILGKAFLNSLLSCKNLNLTDNDQIINLSNFKCQRSQTIGNDQDLFKQATASASASTTNVKTRIEILTKVLEGEATKNTEKENKKTTTTTTAEPKAKKEKKAKVKADNSLTYMEEYNLSWEMINLTNDQLDNIKCTLEAEKNTCLTGLIPSKAMEEDGSIKYILTALDDTGKARRFNLTKTVKRLQLLEEQEEERKEDEAKKSKEEDEE